MSQVVRLNIPFEESCMMRVRLFKNTREARDWSNNRESAIWSRSRLLVTWICWQLKWVPSRPGRSLCQGGQSDDRLSNPLVVEVKLSSSSDLSPVTSDGDTSEGLPSICLTLILRRAIYTLSRGFHNLEIQGLAYTVRLFTSLMCQWRTEVNQFGLSLKSL